MARSTARDTETDAVRQEEASLAAGSAAGYCWARNPNEPGRCTRPPRHPGIHKDVYARTEW